MNQLMNQSMNDKGVYRTAPATLGLLKSDNAAWQELVFITT